jgi:hypothetical protein
LLSVISWVLPNRPRQQLLTPSSKRFRIVVILTQGQKAALFEGRFADTIRMNKQSIGLLTLAQILLACGAFGQTLPMKVKGGHLLGESAEQFFGEGREKELLSACAAKDYKSVTEVDKRLAKNYCSELANARQQAIGGKRCAYQTAGDSTELRTDTFTFADGHLVNVQLIYAAPSAEFNNRGQAFAQIFDTIKQAYGPPTAENTAPARDAYGVQYVAHRELWISSDAAVVVNETPGPGGSTTVIAYTRAEYDRMKAANSSKAANPLE